MKILFIDTETTGFSSKTQDLWQLAGYVTQDKKILDTFNIKCHPINWHTISKGALECQEPPMTVDELRTYQHPRKAFVQFKEILDKHYDPKSKDKFFIAGQNVKSFDWRFINAFWNRHKEKSEPDFQYYCNNNVNYDLLDLTRPLKKKGLLKVENVKLGTIIESLDVKIDGPLHDAMADIEGTYKSFYKMIDIWKKELKKDPSLESLLSDFMRDLFYRMRILEIPDHSDLL